MVYVPDGCTAIGARAFANCPQLVRIHRPETCANIAAAAFAGSENVTLCGVAGGVIEAYAQANGLVFQAE